MKLTHAFLPLFMIFTSAICAAAPKIYTLKSPSGTLSANIKCDSLLSYSVMYDGRELLAPSAISIELADGTIWGQNAHVSKATRSAIDRSVAMPLGQTANIMEQCNTLTLQMKGGWSVEFRVYDDGVAYRFAYTGKTPIDILEERSDFVFPEDFTVSVPYVRTGTDGDFDSQFFNSFENQYTTQPLSQMNSERLSFLPLAIDPGNGIKALITETDLNDYPGLYLYNPDGKTALSGRHAPYPVVSEDGGYNNIQSVVKERAPYIAKINSSRTFPWRIFAVGSDTEIAENTLSYLLASPPQITDISWIKPGKVAWDWWNDWNITGVDFEAGINTSTYRHYIDFASRNGIEYVILDDGWAAGKGEDLMKVNPNIDLPAIVNYATSKNVDIILWAGYRAFERDMENVCSHYSQLGVKGFKVDFEDRDDQLMTAFNHRAAATAAKHKLILDIHGSYKPAGINRTWPNVLNVEGVNGLENLKWSTLDQFDIIKYDVTVPFIRQVSGPMDYTQGAMINASRANFRPINAQPMSAGTRAHQLALYMIFFSPLNMLCDSPSNYDRESEYTEFIASVPTVWDETIVLQGEIGKYIVTARRKGDDWYIGGITDWTPRDLTIDLTPLKLDGSYNATVFTDGINAHRNGTDYQRATMPVDSTSSFRVHMAPGGGFAIHLVPQGH